MAVVKLEQTFPTVATSQIEWAIEFPLKSCVRSQSHLCHCPNNHWPTLAQWL